MPRVTLILRLLAFDVTGRWLLPAEPGCVVLADEDGVRSVQRNDTGETLVPVGAAMRRVEPGVFHFGPFDLPRVPGLTLSWWPKVIRPDGSEKVYPTLTEQLFPSERSQLKPSR